MALLLALCFVSPCPCTEGPGRQEKGDVPKGLPPPCHILQSRVWDLPLGPSGVCKLVELLVVVHPQGHGHRNPMWCGLGVTLLVSLSHLHWCNCEVSKGKGKDPYLFSAVIAALKSLTDKGVHMRFIKAETPSSLSCFLLLMLLHGRHHGCKQR